MLIKTAWENSWDNATSAEPASKAKKAKKKIGDAVSSFTNHNKNKQQKSLIHSRQPNVSLKNRGMLDKAKDAWDSQSTAGKAGIAAGGAAAIGGAGYLANKALNKNKQQQPQQQPQQQQQPRGPRSPRLPGM